MFVLPLGLLIRYALKLTIGMFCERGLPYYNLLILPWSGFNNNNYPPHKGRDEYILGGYQEDKQREMGAGAKKGEGGEVGEGGGAGKERGGNGMGWRRSKFGIEEEKLQGVH